MIVQGWRLLSHPIPWRDVDGITSGPLNSWILSVPICLGAPPTWLTSRVVLFGLNCLTLVFLYRALRCFGRRAEVQLALMPTVFFYAFVLDKNFTHYSSETLPVLLVSAGLCLLAEEWMAERPSKVKLLLLGLISGCLPFTKLQAAPLALFLPAVGLAQIVFNRGRLRLTTLTRWANAGWLGLGAIAVPALILGLVAGNGAWDDFWKSYILPTGGYIQERAVSRPRLLFMLFFKSEEEFRFFWAGAAVALVVLVGIYSSGIRLGRIIFWPLVVVLAALGLTLACIIVPQKLFGHYMLLLIPGTTLFAGFIIFTAMNPGEHLKPADRQLSPGAIAWLRFSVALMIGLQFFAIPVYIYRCRDAFRHPSLLSAHPAVSPVAQQVLKVSRPGDTLSVWGWEPKYYLETGLMCATRDAISHRIISPGPLREYFRKHYLDDLRQSPPTVFIDAVADGSFIWYWTMEDSRHESFPELNEFIETNYVLWCDVRLGRPEYPVRIYIAKERAPAFH